VIILETKFITLDGKESYYEKVDMQRRIVFYPYFRFHKADNVPQPKDILPDTGPGRTYRTALTMDGFRMESLCSLEKTLFPMRTDEYGFWTAEHTGACYIGLGAGSLLRFMQQDGPIDASYAVEKGTDTLYLADIHRDIGGQINADINIYMHPADRLYPDMASGIKTVLIDSGIWNGEIKPEPAEYLAVKYTYSGSDSVRPQSGKHVLLPEQEKKPFKNHVAGCTWHTIVLDGDIINDGPRFVLLRNSGIKLGNLLDGLSHWMVHRRGGFVTGKEFTEGDFHQDTTYIIKEIDEYAFGNDIILNIECDTYSSNLDYRLRRLPKNLSDTRFRK